MNSEATQEHTDACRSTLALLAHGRSIPHRDLPGGVRSTLIARNLITMHTQGLVKASASARGYVACPSSFFA